MATAAELKKAADLLESAWLQRKKLSENAKRRETRAKAAFFEAYEAYVIQQQKEDAAK